jgi:protocatechuate 4,5-dioxygenase alpha subunit
MGKPRHLRPIPDTTIFDLRASRRGARLNRLCASLCSAENRAAFQRDEDGYMSRFRLSEAEKALIRGRDFQGLIEAGTNIYYLLKIGSVTGNGLYKMGAQMRGETYEQFLATRNLKDAT